MISDWHGPEGWTAFWTACLFFATLLLWIFTALMWYATRKAVEEGERALTAAQRSASAAEAAVEAMQASDKRQSEDIKASIAEAARAAKAMEENVVHAAATLEVMKDTAERQLRAYLRVDIESPQETIKGGIAWAAKPGYRDVVILTGCFYVINSGNTPAYNVVDQMRITILDEAFAGGLTFNQKIDVTNRGKCVVNPGQGISITQTVELDMLGEDWNKFRQSARPAFIQGTINFVDAFANPRWITFCFKAAMLANNAIAVDIHQAGNDAN